MVFHGFVWFSLVFQPSHFFIASLGDDEILVSLMKAASVRFWSPFDMWPESIFCVCFHVFAVAYGFSWFCLVFFGFSPVSSFHHIVGGWWKSRFLDENRLYPILITICMWPESIFCVFWMFFAVAYGFPWFVWFSLVFQPSHFFITSLEDDENLVSLMKTASATQ